jgi:hypothetical protein
MARCQNHKLLGCELCNLHIPFPYYVFTRKDFNDLAGYDKVGRVLRELVKEGQLMKVGYGVYTKARQNTITGKLMPTVPGRWFAAVVIEALERLKVDYSGGLGTRSSPIMDSLIKPYTILN